MRATTEEVVTHVRHWSDTLFSFRTTRKTTFTFENGQFVMLGLITNDKPLLRAYSIASANYEDELEFFSIKVPKGALTSKLQHLSIGDKVTISTRPTGTLVPGHLKPGQHLYLLATGTGLAPFLSIVKDPDTYEHFDRVILVHSVRKAAELAYQEVIYDELPNNPYFGESVRQKLVYYPIVTREAFLTTAHQQRITSLIETDTLTKKINLPPLNPEHDRFMLCGNQSMLAETTAILQKRGFQKATSRQQGDFVIEQAFLEK